MKQLKIFLFFWLVTTSAFTTNAQCGTTEAICAPDTQTKTLGTGRSCYGLYFKLYCTTTMNNPSYQWQWLDSLGIWNNHVNGVMGASGAQSDTLVLDNYNTGMSPWRKTWHHRIVITDGACISSDTVTTIGIVQATFSAFIQTPSPLCTESTFIVLGQPIIADSNYINPVTWRFKQDGLIKKDDTSSVWANSALFTTSPIPGNHSATVEIDLICPSTITISVPYFTERCNITGFEAVEDYSKKVRVYPNPANSFFSLDIHTDDDFFYGILHDTYGEIVSRISLENRQQIPVTHLPPGVYLLELFDCSFRQKICKKIFIQH